MGVELEPTVGVTSCRWGGARGFPSSPTALDLSHRPRKNSVDGVHHQFADIGLAAEAGLHCVQYSGGGDGEQQNARPAPCQVLAGV